MKCLRTVAKIVEGICDKNDLLGERSIRTVDRLRDVTRGFLNRTPMKDQKDGGGPEGSPLKKKLGGTRFVYFHRIRNNGQGKCARPF